MTEGKVVSCDAAICRGWAKIAALPQYAVTVHLVLHGRVQASAIADRSAAGGDDPSVTGDCWFEIDVPVDAALCLAECRVLVGESGTYLQDANRKGGPEPASPASSQTPTSFRTALNRGLCVSDVIELLYMDILRRPADKSGLRFHLNEVESGRGSLESFRRSLLDSDEYRKSSLQIREAPGGTFAGDMAYSSSSRRLEMEQSAGAFGRSEVPLRRKLLAYLPGIVALPTAIETLLALADKGIPEREVFSRALSMLSRRPSLIVADRHGPVSGHLCEGASHDNSGITFACASPLFFQGWNRVEQSQTKAFRWMEQVGILLNPQPERRLERIEVTAEEWFGDLDRTITAVAGDMVMACQRRDQESGSTTLIFTSPDNLPLTASRVALIAGAAACPWCYDGTPDMRLLSCRVSGAKFQYEKEAA